VGPGSAGFINVEREAELSGSIHTKAFYILEGLLRSLLACHHPIALDASLAFEQSYGGIDGDSASGAETCCLLSALARIPLRQDLAMTGAIDQFGNILPVGGVNEKIEGFFDVWVDRGMDGAGGVLIPESNGGDLMLRPDLVEAAREGRFAIHAISTIHQALELLTGQSAEWVLRRAEARSRRFWKLVAPRGQASGPPVRSPGRPAR
ncbi:MAG: ATP-dependent protease, partial [Candidatus Eisenbacteria bacterium]|nr:ATP-dependent protease [Candidatus Eisenbacteria bacterium]